jgi:hypothetical protein
LADTSDSDGVARRAAVSSQQKCRPIPDPSPPR